MSSKRSIGARYGLADWAAQLLSALCMLVCLAYLLAVFLVCSPDTYQELRDFVRWESVRVPLLLFILALAWHAWIGGRSVIMDYIPHDGLRLAKTAGLFIYLLMCVLWAAGILWGGT